MISLALRMLRRDARAGELRVLFLALVIAVASVTSVGFFSDRAFRALGEQANELLGADLVLVSDHPLQAKWARLVAAQGLAEAETQIFLSMALAAERNQLVEVKAVRGGYPLRGALRIKRPGDATPIVVRGGPPEGQAWVDPRLLDKLTIRLGDRLTLGKGSLKVTATIVEEPDRGNVFFSVAPDVLINAADVPATGLVQAQSRVEYRLLIAGPRGKIAAFQSASSGQLGYGERLESVGDAHPEMRTALMRAHQFLGLASVVSVVLAGIAIALSLRRFVQRHLDHCAILRCLGARQRDVLGLYGSQLIGLGGLASLVGSGIGYGVQRILADTLAGLMIPKLPPPSWLPLGGGFAVTLISLIGFALPPLLQLGRVSTVRVLRKDLQTAPRYTWLSYGLANVSLVLLVIWQAGEVGLGLYLYAGAVAALALLLLVTSSLLAALNRMRRFLPPQARWGLGQLVRRKGQSVTQMVAFGLGVMALLLLGTVRLDLMSDWEQSLPENAPNRFIINIQPDQLPAVQAFFRYHGQAAPDLYPMARGRLIAINGRAVTPEAYRDERAQRLVEREFNLSWAERLQADNTLTAGQWWGPKERGEALLSLEEGMAQTLHLRLGDRLTFAIAGERLEVKVTSLRKVDWGSFHVNFFAIVPPGVLDRYPVSYLTAFYLPASDYSVLDQFVAQFPNATVIDVAALIDRVRQVIQRVSQALRDVFLFTVLAGFLVLYAAIQATLDDRVRESALLRTLGASRRQLIGGVLAEFGLLGLLAGGTGAVAASGVGYVLARRVFQFSYHWDPHLWMVGLMGGGLSVAVAGAWGTRFILRQPPWPTLQGLDR